MQENDTNTLIVKKVDFVVFIEQEMNCTSQTNKKKSKKLDIIVKSAKRFLDLQDFTAKMLQGVLNEEVPPSQVPERV